MYLVNQRLLDNRHQLGIGWVAPAIAGVAMVGGVTATAAMIYSDKKRKRDEEAVRETFTQALRNVKLNINPLGLMTFPEFNTTNLRLLIDAAKRVGIKNAIIVGGTVSLSGKPVLIFSDPTGDYVCVASRPIDIPKCLMDEKTHTINWNNVYSVIDQCAANNGSNGWFRGNRVNQWKADTQRIQALFESKQANIVPEKLIGRPQWKVVDTLLMVGAGVALVYLSGLYVKRRKRLYAKPLQTVTAKSQQGSTDLLASVKGNPGQLRALPKGEIEPVRDEFERAVKQYEDFHWGVPPDRAFVTEDVPEVPEVVHALGDAIGIVYGTTKKGDEGKTVYVHRFKPPYPYLASDNAGKQLFFIGGRYKVEPRGIVD